MRRIGVVTCVVVARRWCSIKLFDKSAKNDKASRGNHERVRGG